MFYKQKIYEKYGHFNQQKYREKNKCMLRNKLI